MRRIKKKEGVKRKDLASIKAENYKMSKRRTFKANQVTAKAR